jgi:hypothetical protein
MMNIIETIEDPNLFQPWFAGASWNGWRTILKAAFALPITDDERAFFRSIADREPPATQVRELWIIAGRRAGKDSIASVIAAQAASFFEPAGRLRGGERACVLCLAVDRSQATIVLNYVRSYFTDISYLAATVERETKDGFELSNGVDVVVATNSYRSVRGRSVLLAIFDEVGFWRSEASVAPDVETYHAVAPGMATLRDAMLVGITSPHRKAGLAYERWREHYGRDGDDVLVVRAPSAVLNPTIDRRIIDEAMARDPQVARAEWMAEWRDDLSQFLDRQLVEAAVDVGVTVRSAVPGVRYHAFADPSGGANDAFTLGVTHCEKDVVVLDCLVERHAPFNPDQATEEMAETVKSYGVREVTGDRYAGRWVVEAFGKHGVTYRHSGRDRSAIYMEALPLFMSGKIRLLDSRRLVSQFASLERRTTMGRDRIDHPPHMHDDASNAVAGSMVLAVDAGKVRVVAPLIVTSPWPDVGGIGFGGGSRLLNDTDAAVNAVNGIAPDGAAGASFPYERGW